MYTTEVRSVPVPVQGVEVFFVINNSFVKGSIVNYVVRDVVSGDVDKRSTIDDGEVNGKVVDRGVGFDGAFVADCVISGKVDRMARVTAAIGTTEEEAVINKDDAALVAVNTTTVAFSFIVDDKDAVDNDFINGIVVVSPDHNGFVESVLMECDFNFGISGTDAGFGLVLCSDVLVCM
ncbi:hypothetical protein NDU88_007242 [Pleurodeles waltl]|uniref:Uncharacterized protein n=1 Tax=Pleurodeles waltl TaxID=8319 RepID=A0AAV7WCX2_PLEWA|nr:hypothetical protein NDU88_007242 [Pleurodeles waltl]